MLIWLCPNDDGALGTNTDMAAARHQGQDMEENPDAAGETTPDIRDEGEIRQVTT